MKSKRMIDLLIFWLPIIGALLFGSVAVAEWYSGDKVRAIWFGFSGIVCFLLVVALQWQQIIERDQKPDRPDAFVFVEASEFRYLGTNRPIEGWISLRNAGPGPAKELRRIARIFATRYPFNDFQDLQLGDARSVLGPGTAVDFGPMTMSAVLTPEQAAAVVAGTMAIYIYGKVRFVSGSDNRPGCVNFRLMYRGNGQPIGPNPLPTEQLPEGNNTDCPP
jgi:hypothetical protein